MQHMAQTPLTGQSQTKPVAASLIQRVFFNHATAAWVWHKAATVVIKTFAGTVTPQALRAEEGRNPTATRSETPAQASVFLVMAQILNLKNCTVGKRGWRRARNDFM